MNTHTTPRVAPTGVFGGAPMPAVGDITPTDMASLAPRNVLVVVDPSLDSGTAALDLAALHRGDGAGRLTVIVSLTGPAADAFRDLAAAESITIAQAAGAYLARLAAQLSAAGLFAEMMSIPGLDPVVEIASCAFEAGAAAIIVPEASCVVSSEQAPALAELAGAAVVSVPGSVNTHRIRRVA